MKKIYNPKTKRYINDTPSNRLKLKQNGGTLTTTPKRLNVLSTQKLVNTGFTANNITNNKTRNVFTRIKKDHNIRYIPPMGPFIHPDFIKTHEIDVDEKKEKRTIKKQLYRFLYIFV